jgi:WD40 repeat protein/class 3 adenylate cyclase/energy-coupling factor transporter ATP-binding protein EcfA2
MRRLPSGTVTFLFTDIEGSTRLLEELGDRYAPVLTRHRRILRDSFEQHGGQEVDTQGDSFFVAFRDANGAIGAAAAAQRGLAAEPWPDGVAVLVRMGVHTGEPLVADDHYVGIDVHRGARIAAAAHGGQVLVSKRTRDLVSNGAAAETRLRELGAHRLKDLPKPEPLFQLILDGLPSSFPPPRAHKDAPAAAGLADYSLPPADVPCPYKGLVPFQPEDAELFFGREALVAALLAKLEEAPFLAVVGPSGSGKSSLVRAGLVPALERTGGTSIILSPGQHPLRELALGLSEVLGHQVDALIERLSADPRALSAEIGRVAVVVDQFEEVFTLCRSEEERSSFIGALLGLLAGAEARVILALRADFYGQCAQYPALASALEKHQGLIGPMSEEELRRSIERPADEAGLVLEPGLVEAILRDVIGEPGALPLLSHSLLETWTRRSGRMLTLIGYLHSGGVRGAIAKTAETVFHERLDPNQQALARNAFLRLTELGEGTEDTRRRASLSELVPRLGQEDEVAEVLRLLAEARLVTIGEGEVEVAHEALIRHWPTLRGWLDEDREGRLVHRRLTETAQEWQALGRDPGALYRGTRLAGASEWAELHDSELNELEREFLEASRAAELGEIEATRRRNRRLRILVAALALILAGALVAGALALVQRQNAREAATAAVAQRLGAQALVQKDLDLSLLLARQGVDVDDSLVTRGNLLAALVRSPAAIGISRPLRGRLLHIDITPDGRIVGVSNNDGEVALVDARTRRTLRTFQGDFFFFTRDSKTVGLGEPRRGRLVLAEIASGKPVKTFRIPPDVHAMSLSRDARRLATVSGPGTVAVVRDLSTGRVAARIRARPGHLFWDVFMPDQAHLLGIESRDVSEQSAAVLELWDVGTKRSLGSVPSPAAGAPYALSADESRLAVPAEDGSSVVVRDLRTGESRQLNGRHNGKITGIGFGPGNRLATTGDDKQTLVWDLQSGSVEELLAGHNGRVFGPAFSRDGRTLYTVSLDGTMMVWDLAGTRRLGRPFHAGSGHANEQAPRTLVVSPRGDRLVVTEGDGRIVIRDSRSLRELRSLRAIPQGPAVAAAFSPDERVVAVSGEAGAVSVWDVASGASVHRRLPGPPRAARGRPNYVRAVGFTPDGRTVVAGDDSRHLYFWNARSGAPIGQPLALPSDPALPDPAADQVYALAFSGNGLLAVGHGSNASVWELGSRKLRYSVDVDEDYGFAAAVTFSPDDSLLVTGGGIGEVRFWDAKTGEQRGRSITASAGWVNSLDFDRMGEILVTGGTDGTTRLIDVESRVLIGSPLPGFDNLLENAELTPDGRRVIVVYDNGVGFVWEVDPTVWKKQGCAVAGRDLTRAEWDQFLPDREYRPVCSGA